MSRTCCAGSAACAPRYGVRPDFIFTSATVGDPPPGLRAVRRVGAPGRGRRVATRRAAVRAVEPTAARRGHRHPGLDQRRGGGADRRARRGRRRTVAFCRSRKATEIVRRLVRRSSTPTSRAGAILPRRLPASERREIETELFDGQLAASWPRPRSSSASTSVGSTPACSTASPAPWLQCGSRPGGPVAPRSDRWPCSSPATDQLDQWLMAHPREVFTRPPEPAVVNLSNPFVLLPHLACAAFEAPLSLEDEQWWGDDLGEGVRQLVVQDRLVLRNRRAVGRGGARRPPASAFGRAPRRVPHRRRRRTTGRHRRRIPRVRVCPPRRDLPPPGPDLPRRVARPRRPGCDRRASRRRRVHAGALRDERADPRDRGDAPDRPSASAPRSGAVTSHVVGYDRRDVRSHTSLGYEPLDLPPTRLVTRAFWYTVGPDVIDAGPAVARAGARNPARGRARRHRHPPALHDLRSMGRWRRVDRVPGGHRSPDDRHLRRLSRRCRHRRARLRGGADATSRPHWQSSSAAPARRLPVVRAEPQVRQWQRAPRQGRSGRLAPRRTRLSPRALIPARLSSRPPPSRARRRAIARSAVRPSSRGTSTCTRTRSCFVPGGVVSTSVLFSGRPAAASAAFSAASALAPVTAAARAPSRAAWITSTWSRTSTPTWTSRSISSAMTGRTRASSTVA